MDLMSTQNDPEGSKYDFTLADDPRIQNGVQTPPSIPEDRNQIPGKETPLSWGLSFFAPFVSPRRQAGC